MSTENKTLSRLMAAVSKSKIYKDTSKAMQDMAEKTVECAVKTTSHAQKHYKIIKKKYDDDIRETSVQSMSYINKINSSNNVTNESIEQKLVPKYRIVKQTLLDPNIQEMSSSNQLINLYIEIPGVKSSTIELKFYYSEMTIIGKKMCPYNINQKCNGTIDESIVGNTLYGNLEYTIQLPINVNEPRKVETQYIDGVLIVSIPTTEYIEPIIVKHKRSRSKIFKA